VKRQMLLVLLIIAPLSLATAKEYGITVLNPLDTMNRQDCKASANLVGKSITAIFGEISEIRLDPVWEKGAPATDPDKIKTQVRERIDNAKCVGRQSERNRSMASWVHGYMLLKNGRIVPIKIMLGGIIVGDDLLFGDEAEPPAAGDAGKPRP
jgi:hypothetical protein